MSQQIRIAPFRYSLRTFLFFVFVAACYFACGQPTRTAGVNDLIILLNPEEELEIHGTYTIPPYFTPPPKASYVAPLIVRFPTMKLMPGEYEMPVDGEYDHYLWFFGWIVRLPC